MRGNDFRNRRLFEPTLHFRNPLNGKQRQPGVADLIWLPRRCSRYAIARSNEKLLWAPLTTEPSGSTRV